MCLQYSWHCSNCWQRHGIPVSLVAGSQALLIADGRQMGVCGIWRDWVLRKLEELGVATIGCEVFCVSACARDVVRRI